MSERATELVEIYGSYPVARQFASNDLAPDLQDNEVPGYDAAFDPDPTVKRHAACDECSMACSNTPSLVPPLLTRKFHRKAQVEMFRRAQRMRALHQATPHLPLLCPEADGPSEKETKDRPG